jgi:hypothetical protein
VDGFFLVTATGGAARKIGRVFIMDISDFFA